jgi:hypothetical protein
MKLAEAPRLRADMQKNIASLRGRIAANAVVQEGEQPAEDPEHLLLEGAGVIGDLARLMFRINACNLSAKLEDGCSLTEAIAKRDALIPQHAPLEAALEGTRNGLGRYSAREIKWVATSYAKQLQKQADDVSKSIREMNARIQEANWKVELPDE